MSVSIIINSPTATLLEIPNVDSISLPSLDGEVTISSERRALMASLRTGVIYVFNSNKTVSKYFIMRGIARFSDNILNIATTEMLDLSKVTSVADFTNNPQTRPEILKQDSVFNVFLDCVNNPIY